MPFRHTTPTSRVVEGICQFVATLLLLTQAKMRLCCRCGVEGSLLQALLMRALLFVDSQYHQSMAWCWPCRPQMGTTRWL